jgi:hypothetical protein
MHRVGVLGNGVHRTFEYISRAITDGTIENCEVVVVTANRPNVPLFASAAKVGVPYVYLDGGSPGEIDVQALEGVYDVDRTACPIDLDGLVDVRAWIECGGIRLT